MILYLNDLILKSCEIGSLLPTFRVLKFYTYVLKQYHILHHTDFLYGYLDTYRNRYFLKDCLLGNNLRTQTFLKTMHRYFFSLPFKKGNSGKIYSSLIYDPALDYLGLIGLSETSCNLNLLIYWYAHVVFNISRSN